MLVLVVTALVIILVVSHDILQLISSNDCNLMFLCSTCGILATFALVTSLSCTLSKRQLWALAIESDIAFILSWGSCQSSIVLILVFVKRVEHSSGESLEKDTSFNDGILHNALINCSWPPHSIELSWKYNLFRCENVRERLLLSSLLAQNYLAIFPKALHNRSFISQSVCSSIFHSKTNSIVSHLRREDESGMKSSVLDTQSLTSWQN